MILFIEWDIIDLLTEEHMKVRRISFKGDSKTKAAHISENHDIEKAIEELQSPQPAAVIVLVGGAGGSRRLPLR